MGTRQNEEYIERICSENHSIVAGPSRALLLDALKYAYDEDCLIRISFNVIKDYEKYGYEGRPLCMKDVKIISVAHESGSGHSFNIAGQFTHDAMYVGPVRLNFTAFYDTQNKTGSIRFYR